MEKLDSVIFSKIDRAIRTYRQFTQARLKALGHQITIDQWLVIKCLIENPRIQQNEISELIFKDAASVNRMVNLLVDAKYLKRRINKSDRRKMDILVTRKALDTIDEMDRIIPDNRAFALSGLTLEEMQIATKVMTQIASNCRK
ncbi:MarR family transcriptional regulator [Fluviicola sp.]|jgi:DNA-binding MarR family transcriptional regulator|uniref:MarR family winged helix-turn-helix transcriptional regulator n=1 Tax=Fluviicola sp. TaxID=1917219 RepID=UPI002836ACE0|nr:MarR family transcriptional regulator [Fluviicola sp.]MDR0802415.1 MarR family transcriptional regulator [Fluviicola sp.]